MALWGRVVASIADVFVTVLPETSKIASGIRDALRDADKDVSEAGRRWRGEIERELKDVKATVNVDADTGKARAEIDEVARDRHTKVHVDIDKSGLDQLTSSLGGLGGAGGAGGGGISAMGAGIAGLIPIASALSGVLGLVPAALGGAGLAAGTLVTGLSGVKDAYTAVGDASKSANQDQKEKTEAVASATRELQGAIRSEASAQQDVANARKDARQQLDDLNLSLQGGKIDEAQAYNNLLKARRDLASGSFKDQLDYNDAVLRVDQAQQTYNESIQRNTELQTKANDQNAKGVEGSDQVVAANNRLMSTQDQVAQAQQKMSDATAKTSSEQQKAAQALALLSPNAQAFVAVLQQLKPAWDDLQNTVQDNLFAGVGQQIQGLAQTFLPILKSTMGEMATTMNQAFGEVAKVLQSPAGVAGIKDTFANLGKAFQAFAPAIPTLVQAFGQLTQVGSTFLPQLGTAFSQAASSFSQFIQQAASSGQLQQWISTGIQAMSQLGQIAQTVFKAFLDLGPLGTAIISALNQTLTALAPAIPPLASAFTALVTAVTPILPVVANLVSQLVGALAPAATTLFQALAPVIQQLATSLTPVINQLAPIIAQTATNLAGPLAGALRQLIPFIGPLVQAFSQFLLTLAPLLPQIVRLATDVLPVLIGAVKGNWLVITDLFKLLNDGAKVVLPVFMNVVGAFGKVWSNVFNGIKDVVKTVWDFIKPIFDNIKGFLDTLPGPLKDLLGLHDGSITIPKGGTQLKPPGAAPAAGEPPGRLGWSSPQHKADWDKIAGPESGGNWQTNTGNGFSGGLQFTPQSWAAAGGLQYAPTADQATPEQQKTVADKLLQMQGPGAWPATSAAHPDWFAPPAAAPTTTTTVAPTTSAPVIAAPAAAMPSAAPATINPADAALLQHVPAGTYSQPGSGNWDLTKGLGDCSSAVEDLVNILQGNSTAGRNMSTGNEAQWLTSHGFMPNTTGANVPGAFNVGFNDHHTQATLPGGTNFNWGSDAAAAKGGVDGTGAFDPAFTQHYYMPTNGAPGMPNAPLGTPQAPIYTATAPNQPGMPDSGKLGQDVGGDLWETFGIPGVKNPADMGITKFFTGLLGGALGMNIGGGKGGGMPASYYAGGGGAGGGAPAGGGGDLLSGLLGMATGLMPGAQQGNSPNIADAAQFKPPGAAGPGNVSVDNSFTFNGTPTSADSSNMMGPWTSQNRYAPLAQNLPR